MPNPNPHANHPRPFHLFLPLCLTLATSLTLPPPASACTNFIASKGATTDGSVIVTYTCDGEFHPLLRLTPAADHQPGDVFQVTTWGDQVLGEVAQPPHTYAVMKLMNENQVTIGETTTGGREELINPDGLLPYWHLMGLTLQRAESARHAIQIMGQLMDEYGYRSSGESFAIGDPEEAWIMEVVGPGPGGQGAHWVALRVPDGYVSAYANMGRIGTFDPRDKKNCLTSGPGMIRFAQEQGWYDPADGPFNWREAFHPADPQRLRYTATRVWSLFRRCGVELPADYHRGTAGAEPYPLWIKPEKKLDVADVFALMRDHYEGTEFDMTRGVDAGPYGNPSRWRPMGFELDGHSYTWERPISTQQTGFSMVTQSRSWLPDPIGGVTWYGLDRFSWDSAWWTFNFVSNFAALKYRYMSPDIQAVQDELEGHLLALQPAVEMTAKKLAKEDPQLMRAYLTDYSVQHAEDVVRKWRDLGEYLITTYNDGYVKDADGRVTEKGYPESWLRAVIRAHPDKYRLPDVQDLEEPADY